MKKQFAIFGLSFSLLSIAHTQVTEAWVSPEPDYAKTGIMITADNDGNTFTAHHIFNGDIYVTKRDANGAILWTSTYDNTAPSQWEQAAAITVDVNGDAIVTGYTNTGFGTDWYPLQMVTMKFDGGSGTLVWRETFSTGVAYRGRRLLTDNEGNIYVGGDVNAWMVYHSEVGNMMIKKYDPNGNELWTLIADNAGNPIPGLLTVMDYDADSNLVISGTAGSLAKISPEGNILWLQTGIPYGIKDISQDPAGNIFALSHASFGAPPAISTDITVTKFNSSGTTLWSQHYDFGSQDFGQQIECDGAGGAFIIGYNNIYFDWLIFKINGAGIQQWQQVYDEHTGNDEIPKKMVKDADDNIYVTGQGGPWPGYFWLSLVQTVTLKFDSDGNEMWTALHTTYTSTSSDICLGPDNSVFVLGSQYAVVIRYNQDTPLICDYPAGLFTNSITTTKAKLNWVVEPGAIQYEIWYKKTAAINWKKKFVPGMNNKLTLKNLTCNTDYVWKIRTICDTVGVDFKSEFSPEQYFTTLTCREDGTELNHAISVYPNPASNMLYINIEDVSLKAIYLYTSTGNLLLAQTISSTESQIIDVSQIPSGLYLLQAVDDKNNTYPYKILIAH